MTMHFNPRKTRGIVAVRANAGDPAALVGQITTAFERHRDGVDSRLDSIEAGLGDLAARGAAADLGVGSGDNRAVAFDAMTTVLRDAAKGGGVTDVSAQLVGAVQAAGMSVGSDPGGGYSVIPSFDAAIRSIARDMGAMRSVANIQQINGDAFEFLLNTTKADAGWVGETEARPDTDAPTLRKVSIPAHEIYAQPKATQKLVDDSSVDIAAWLSGEVGRTFGEKEGEAFITGNGILKPKGLLTYPTAATGDDTRDWGTFEHINTGASGDFASTDPADTLVTTVYKLKTAYRRNARWMMSSDTAAAVRKLKIDDKYLWQESIAEGEPARLLGYPVSVDEFMPVVAANSLSIAFGDFQRAYTIVDRVGIRVLIDNLTDKPHVKFYTTMRVGGSAVDFNAMKFVRFGS